MNWTLGPPDRNGLFWVFYAGEVVAVKIENGQLTSQDKRRTLQFVLAFHNAYPIVLGHEQIYEPLIKCITHHMPLLPPAPPPPEPPEVVTP